MDMRHGSLRTSCSRNPENTSNPLTFSSKKWLLFSVLRSPKVIKFHASMKFMTFCRLSHFILPDNFVYCYHTLVPSIHLFHQRFYLMNDLVCLILAVGERNDQIKIRLICS